MVLKADQQRVRALIKDTLTLLCKNGLHYRSEFCIEALIGITLDKDDVMLVSINETIQDGLDFKVQTSDAPSPAISDSSDSRHRTKEHSSSKPHTQSFEHSSHDSGLSSSAQTSPRSPAKSSSRDSSGERKSPTGFGEPRKKRSRRKSSESDSQPSTPNVEAVKLEESLPDGSSFLITRSDFSDKTGSSIKSDPLTPSQHSISEEDSDDVVVIKEEELSDTELQNIHYGLDQVSARNASQGIPEIPAMQGSMEQMNYGQASIAESFRDPSVNSQKHGQERMDASLISIICDERGVKTFYCKLCSFKSAYKVCAQRHVKLQHLKLKGHFPCKLCSCSYPTKKGLAKHILEKHKYACPRPLRCIGCKLQLVSLVDLREHLSYEHGLVPDQHVFMCSTCGFETKDQWLIRGHLRAVSRCHSSVL